MASATATQTTWGYSITGGTDATLVHTGPLWIKGMAFSGDDATDTCTIVCKASNTPLAAAVSFYKFTAITADHAAENHVTFPTPIEVIDPTVTLSDDGSYLYLFT